MDIAANICDYAGAPPLPKMTIARTWRPLLQGDNIKWRNYVICETSAGQLSVCVRDARFKSIIYQDKTKLYDIQNDPLETIDLADDPTYATIKKRHRQQFREYISQIEIYPGPPDTDKQSRKLKHGNLYKAYVEWYESVKAEG